MCVVIDPFIGEKNGEVSLSVASSDETWRLEHLLSVDCLLIFGVNQRNTFLMKNYLTILIIY